MSSRYRDLRARLRHVPGYDVWRAHRERQRLNAFRRLLVQATSDGARCSDQRARDGSRALEGMRRRPRPGEPVGIVAFGATGGWEDFGLWQAFSRLARFSLFDYGRVRPRAPSAAARVEIGRQFLQFLTDRDQPAAPVHVAFFYASGAYLDPNMLREIASRGIWTVVLALDDKQQMPGRPVGGLRDWQLETALTADLYWTTFRAGADWLAGRGARPWYAPEAADPVLFAPRPGPKDVDVLWIGSGYGTRLRLVRSLRQLGFAVRAFGDGWEGGPVSFDRMVDMYSRAKVVLGMGGAGPTDRVKHLKGRDFEVPMCGAAYLTSFNPELADHFRIGEEVLCYSGPEDAAEVLEWVLRRPDVLAALGAAARARSVRDHTWTSRIGAMLRLLGIETSRPASQGDQGT